MANSLFSTVIAFLAPIGLGTALAMQNPHGLRDITDSIPEVPDTLSIPAPEQVLPQLKHYAVPEITIEAEPEFQQPKAKKKPIAPVSAKKKQDKPCKVEYNVIWRPLKAGSRGVSEWTCKK